MIISGGIQADWFLNELAKYDITSQQISAQLLKFGIKESNTPFLPADIYLKLFNWAAQQTKNKAIGLHLAKDLDLRDIGVYGYILLNSDSVAELIDNLQKYKSIFMTGMGYSFHNHDSTFEIRSTLSEQTNDIAPQGVEFSMALFSQFFKNNLSTAPLPTKVTFCHKQISFNEQYQQVFGDNVTFAQQNNSLFFDASIIQSTLMNSDGKLKEIIQEHANNLLEVKPQHHDIVSLVRITIASKVSREDFSIESVCKELDIHQRTLHRQLKKQNTSYKIIKDEVILELAKDALINTNLSVSDIAVQLCFSESSAFIRYFRRVMNISPTTYRKQHAFNVLQEFA